MSIRNLITHEIVIPETVVELPTGEKFLFRGRTDVAFFTDNFLIDPQESRRSAMHAERVIKEQYPDSDIVVDDAFVRNSRLIHATLQPQFWDKATGTWIMETSPLDISEIYCLMVERGELIMLKFLPAAFEVCGITDENMAQGNNPMVDQALMGNSQTEPTE